MPYTADVLERPFLSVAIPAHNEIETMEESAARTLRSLESIGRSYELVLVDDGSTDGTADVIRRIADREPRCRAIFHPRRTGIAAVIRACYFQTRGSWATWFPADLQADPGALPSLVSALDSCDVLLTHRDARLRSASGLRKAISGADRSMARWLFGLDLEDLHWIHFFRRELLDRMTLRSRSPAIDLEMIVAARRLGARIALSPLPDHPRRGGRSKSVSAGTLTRSFVDVIALWMRTRGANRDAEAAVEP